MQLSTINLSLTRAYGGGSPAWSPISLFANSEVGTWYDPSDLTTMFQDRAGTTPVTADGQTVGKILDKSGLGNHATAPSDAARPLYKTDGTYHWLQFDGVDDSLSTAAINFTSTDKMSVFNGVRKLSNSDDIIYEFSDNTGPGRPGSFYAAALEGSTGYTTKLGGNVTDNSRTSTGQPAPITNIITALFDFSKTTAAEEHMLRIDGTESGTILGGAAGTGNFGNYSLYIGARSITLLFLNGNIYSLIVRGALSTTQEITDTETWVAAKTGVTL